MKRLCMKIKDILPEALPFVYADIGAMGGICKKWEQIRNHLWVVAFEPDEREYVKLKEKKDFFVLNKVVYRQSAPVEFYVAREAGKSSLLPPNTAVLKYFRNVERFDIVRRISIPQSEVASLDELATAEKVFPNIDFLKVDTQGSELSILEGARTKVLNHVLGAQIEVEAIPLYEGQPLLEDVLTFMRKEGFDLYDLCRTFWKKAAFSDYIGHGQFIFGDALFLRRVESFLSIIKQNPGCARSLLGKAILISFVYRVFDHAYAILEGVRPLSVVTAEEYHKLSSLIKKAAWQGVCPNFPGKTGVFKALRYLAEKLMPRSHLGWSDRDRWIGNVRDL